MKRKRHWTHHEEKLHPAIYRRDNWECQIRGPNCTVVAECIDHIHPKAWGGLGNPENLRAACKACNQSRGARPDTAPFLNQHSQSRAPLQKIPPRSRWGVIRSDYSRKDTNDGGSAA